MLLVLLKNGGRLIGYWAQHQFWESEMVRCRTFLQDTTAESAREKAFLMEQQVRF